MRALRRQTLFLHLTAGAPAGKPAACRLIRLPDGCGAVALSDRRTVLRSKLRIANESAAQCRCERRTAVRATPYVNAGWIGRSKIRLSKNRRRGAAFERLCGGMRPTARTDRGTDIAVRVSADAAARASAVENTGPSLSARRAALCSRRERVPALRRFCTRSGAA